MPQRHLKVADFETFQITFSHASLAFVYYMYINENHHISGEVVSNFMNEICLQLHNVSRELRSSFTDKSGDDSLTSAGKIFYVRLQ